MSSTTFVKLFRCRDCGRKYRFRTEDMDEPVPDCPECGSAVPVDAVPPSLQTPAAPMIRTTQTKANDLAQEIIAEQYKMTDLRVDNLREGDTSAPKLTPKQQELAAAWSGMGQQRDVSAVDTGQRLSIPIPDSSTLLNMARSANAGAPAVPMIGAVQRGIKASEDAKYRLRQGRK